MREILFRGKRIDNGEWVYGFLYETEKSSSYNAESYILEKERLTINYKCLEGITTHILFVQVTPNTVGQYTGLTDKNGKKIFEGDIVSGFFNHEKIVGYIFYGLDASFFIQRDGLFGIGLNNASDWLEVIGNIHDNPELLDNSELFEDKP